MTVGQPFSRSDTKAFTDQWLMELTKREGLYFDDRDAVVINTASDHGYNAYVCLGLVEANRPFDVWVLHVEESDGMRYVLLQLPEDGSEPIVRDIQWEVNYG